MRNTNQLLDATITGREADLLRTDLRNNIIGQDEAINQMVSIYQTYRAGLHAPGRPIGNVLFLGPTGTGKTRFVEAMAESLVGDARAVIKIDCGEFQHSHEIAKLIGSPPGYLGHRETHALLCQEVLDRFHTDRMKISFVLFDEFEKASDSLWNLLLGILDKATLTLGDNQRVNFSRALIFMTSNLGAREMEEIVRPRMGFGTTTPMYQSLASKSGLGKRIVQSGMNAVRRKFTPEFINRIDKTVVFKSLGPPELRKILDMEIQKLQQRIGDANTMFSFRLTDAAKDQILREGTDPTYGARHLKRAIERLLVHSMSNLIASGQVQRGEAIVVDYDAKQARMDFYKEASAASMRRG